MNKKNAFRRGFTLIELMIVIVILGILMGTILPRLTGAQARARDTARKADLTNISQALEVYYGDTGQYPAAITAGTVNCLDSSAATPDTVVTALGGYMKGGKVPMAVSQQQKTLGCTGSYFYKPLSSGTITRASYVLASDVETWQLANYIAGGSAGATTAASAGIFSVNANASTYIQNIKGLSAETTNPQNSIYIVIP